MRRRFNEAPIHESGKFIKMMLDGDTDFSFNEAPIHESGKFGEKLHVESASSQLQ